MTEKKETIVNLSQKRFPDPPIKVTTDILTQTDGPGLLQNARINRALASSIMFAQLWTSRWPEEEYVAKKANTLLNLSISFDGKGRDDLVTLTTGTVIPDAYYSSGNEVKRGGGTSYIRREE